MRSLSTLRFHLIARNQMLMRARRTVPYSSYSLLLPLHMFHDPHVPCHAPHVPCFSPCPPYQVPSIHTHTFSRLTSYLVCLPTSVHVSVLETRQGFPRFGNILKNAAGRVSGIPKGIKSAIEERYQGIYATKCHL